MSARMLRRALKEQETQQSTGVEGSTDDEVEESPTGKPALNLFSLLGSEASHSYPAHATPLQFTSCNSSFREDNSADICLESD